MKIYLILIIFVGSLVYWIDLPKLDNKNYRNLVEKIAKYSNSAKEKEAEIKKNQDLKNKKILEKNIANQKKETPRLKNPKLIKSLSKIKEGESVKCFSDDPDPHPACKVFQQKESKIKLVSLKNNKEYIKLVNLTDKKLPYEQQKSLFDRLKNLAKENNKYDFNTKIKGKSLITNGLKYNKFIFNLISRFNFSKNQKLIKIAYDQNSIFLLSKLTQRGMYPNIKIDNISLVLKSCLDNKKNIFTFLLTELNTYKSFDDRNKIDKCLDKNNWRSDEKVNFMLNKKPLPKSVKYFSGKKFVDEEKMEADKKNKEKMLNKIENKKINDLEKSKEMKEKIKKNILEIL